MRKLDIVLDTNVFIVSLIPHMKYYWVYETLLQGAYNLQVSNEPKRPTISIAQD